MDQFRKEVFNELPTTVAPSKEPENELRINPLRLLFLNVLLTVGASLSSIALNRNSHVSSRFLNFPQKD